MSGIIDDVWLSMAAAAARAGMHYDTMRRLNREGNGPRFIRDPRTNRYKTKASWVDAWMKGNQ